MYRLSPLSLQKLSTSIQINEFKSAMIEAGLIPPCNDFLEGASVYGLYIKSEMLGGFVHSDSPRRILSVVSSDGREGMFNSMARLGIEPNSVQELSALWADKSLGFFSRFVLVLAAAFIALRQDSSRLVLMCCKKGLIPFYESGKPQILFRETEGMKIERIYLYSATAALRTVSMYPYFKMQCFFRKFKVRKTGYASANSLSAMSPGGGDCAGNVATLMASPN